MELSLALIQESSDGIRRAHLAPTRSPPDLAVGPALFLDPLQQLRINPRHPDGGLLLLDLARDSGQFDRTTTEWPIEDLAIHLAPRL